MIRLGWNIAKLSIVVCIGVFVIPVMAAAAIVENMANEISKR